MEICKWKYNADSPVLFMIDDLCNAWVDLNGNGKIDIGEDFGAGLTKKNSSFKFLEENILRKFPWVKVNFYVPVGKRIGMIKNSKIKMYSNSIDANKESINFFKSINNNPKYELSYHGLTHGQVFEKSEEQKQEWECYNSLEEAVEKIEKGKEIFKKVTGEYPKGGKYCGYTSGEYGDESINETNFLWWHRFWNKGLEEKGCEKKYTGRENNKIYAYDICRFGKKGVIDIPSTINGGLFKIESNTTIKKIIKLFLFLIFYRKAKKQLDFLLKNQLVISIQEHISFARDDGKKQYPNIFDDKNSLKRIFKYLKNKKVWYCTGTELADYYILRTTLKIVNNEKYFFFENIEDKMIQKEITIKFFKGEKKIILPSKEEINIKNNIATIKIFKGVYTLL